MLSDEDALRIIKNVKARIAKRSNWCTEEWAMTKIGNKYYPIQPEELAACQWCLMGAVRKERSMETIPFFSSQIYAILTMYMRRGEGDQLDCFNDANGFEAVHELLDRAIEDLEQLVRG